MAVFPWRDHWQGWPIVPLWYWSPCMCSSKQALAKAVSSFFAPKEASKLLLKLEGKGRGRRYSCMVLPSDGAAVSYTCTAFAFDMCNLKECSALQLLSWKEYHRSAIKKYLSIQSRIIFRHQDTIFSWGNSNRATRNECESHWFNALLNSNSSRTDQWNWGPGRIRPKRSSWKAFDPQSSWPWRRLEEELN